MSRRSEDNSVEQGSDLHRMMRDLVSLSALPAAWRGYDPKRIAESLAEAICRILGAELAFVQLDVTGRMIPPVACTCQGDSVDAAALQAAVKSFIDDPAKTHGTLAYPDEAGKLNIAITRFGNPGSAGVLIAGSSRPGFPSERESLMLSVASNQGALALQRRGADESRALLAAIVESSDDAIVSKTLDGIITSWNSGAQMLFGYTPSEAIGRSILMLIPSDRRHDEELIINRIRRGERVEHYETVRVRKDGTSVDVSLTISPLREPGGQIIGASKIARNITERRKAEEERSLALAREHTARIEAQILNELARSMGADLDLHRVVQQATDAATALTDAGFGAFFYNTTNEHGESYQLFTLSGAPRDAFEKFGLPRNTPLFSPTFRGEGVIRIDDVLQDPRYGKNAPYQGMPPGHLPIRSYLAVPVRSHAGEVLGGLFLGHPEPGIFTEGAERLAMGVAAQAGVCIDNAQLFAAANNEIIERRRAEERERAARTDAERAARLRDDFLATLSHELRTPLSGILGWTQLLRRAPDDPQTRAQALDAIERGTRVQTRLIEDLLDMSRIISGKLRIDVRTVDLPPIIDAAIETMRPAAEAKNIRIERVLDPRAGPIKGDAARLQQVMWNFLSNAVKFTPRDGTIQVHLERVNSHIEISVSDTGRGIPADFLPHVFDRFSQADSSTTRRYGGLGLGLAVVKHIVELHGGKVSARSAGEGQGATFTVHLPIAIVRQDAQGREHPLTPSEHPELPADINLSGLRILLVDDDVDSCDVLRRVLAECGARTDMAYSADQALQSLETNLVDVIVSDIGMPEMDGYQLIRAVRERGSRTPAVALTAFARPEDRIRALRAGYNMHIAKPIEPRELIEVIASLTRTGATR